jgi:sugar phosphate isomerase/epimerase
MNPRFSIIDSTTPSLSFAECLSVYRQAGADGIGISERRLRNTDDDLPRFQGSGLQASSCFLAVGSILPGRWLPGPDRPEQRVLEACRGIQRLASFQPDHCHIVSGPSGQRTPQEARELVVAGLRTLAPVAADAGMTLALELMHPSLADDFGFVHTVGEAIGLLEEVGHANAAIAIDVWHFDPDRESLADLRAHAHRIATVHIDDRPQPTRSWCDRVLPGDGTANLNGILSSLQQGGFDGWYELEILSDNGSVEHDFPDSLWKQDPFELVTAGRAKFLHLWQATGASPT